MICLSYTGLERQITARCIMNRDLFRRYVVPHSQGRYRQCQQTPRSLYRH